MEQPQQTQLATVDTSTAINALVPTSYDGAMKVASWLAQSSLLPKSVNKEFDIFFIITAGMEIGIPPMAALRSLYVVNGRTALESRAKMALCLSKGAAIYFKRVEHTAEATTWETLRRGQTEPVRLRYTRTEAIAAFLAPGPNPDGKGPPIAGKEGPWRQYTQRMISHRALGWICDDVYPDVVLGVATAEDFDQNEFTYRPIAGAGGIELGTPAPREQAAATDIVPGTPRTAKSANPPKEQAPAQEFPKDTSKQGDSTPAGAKEPAKEPASMTDADMEDIIERIGKYTNEKELKEYSEKQIKPRAMSEVQRNKLLNIYADQIDTIRDAAKREKAGQ